LSPGKAAYEQRKQQKKDLKVAQEDAFEKRQRREAAADTATDLILVAVTAFLKGEAAFIVTEGPHGSKVVAFGSIPSSSTPS